MFHETLTGATPVRPTAGTGCTHPAGTGRTMRHRERCNARGRTAGDGRRGAGTASRGGLLSERIPATPRPGLGLPPDARLQMPEDIRVVAAAHPRQPRRKQVPRARHGSVPRSRRCDLGGTLDWRSPGRVLCLVYGSRILIRGRSAAREERGPGSTGTGPLHTLVGTEPRDDVGLHSQLLRTHSPDSSSSQEAQPHGCVTRLHDAWKVTPRPPFPSLRACSARPLPHPLPAATPAARTAEPGARSPCRPGRHRSRRLCGTA